jgi:5-methyltetrahydrofolate--homocysteine methyltransferase
MSNDLKQLISDLEETPALELIKQRLTDGEDAQGILEECQQAVNLVGKRYEDGEYFISELMMVGEIIRQAFELLKPALMGKSTSYKGAVVLGTVKGDIHNIGKDLVVTMASAAGYDVHDLGVDVPAQKFVDEVKASGAKVVGLSGLITTSYDGMRETVEAFTTAGLRDQVVILIGGGVMNDTVLRYTGADAWGKDSSEAIALFDKFTGH